MKKLLILAIGFLVAAVVAGYCEEQKLPEGFTLDGVLGDVVDSIDRCWKRNI